MWIYYKLENSVICKPNLTRWPCYVHLEKSLQYVLVQVFALIIPVYEREINKVNSSCIWNKFNKKVNNSLRKSHSYWPLLFDIFLCNIQWPHACTIK